MSSVNDSTNQTDSKPSLTKTHYELLDEMLACDHPFERVANEFTPEQQQAMKDLAAAGYIFDYTDYDRVRVRMLWAISNKGRNALRAQQRSEPSTLQDVNALPADLRDYGNMTIEELREVTLQLPWLKMNGVISHKEKVQRTTTAIAYRGVKLAERDLADAQRVLDRNRAALASVLADAASNGDGEARDE